MADPVFNLSILTTVKKALGIAEAAKEFDPDVIMHINSVFLTLTQIGVGPSSGFRIDDETKVWKDFLSEETRLLATQSYMYLKVRLLFDPPSTSFVLTSMENQALEFLWRLNVEVETPSNLVPPVDPGPDPDPSFQEALDSHINDPEPHPAYDEDIPSLSLIFENGLT